mmetsp:Transcript_9937/g.14976  ORF Transcript_9937/g.14976 Transcript_9937/m.14976 type:complete len:119 (+) Transcript_9937:101-457(+)|eukprot:CAMPEP_0185024204 /NCGR_PEP_ID=MMETSP1103-20130426/7183_1 /TAXON_ID=36769 /ORGANISM="Paraphysomonas bandaiensis, Strain Caron Lab Isolate" /LENGTH=118 /DNA_ID=CAMNT_0027557115 /DNA_START=99 /DNA_END=455 /DNA_ORIENTATION=-
MSADSLTIKSRDFYERSKVKLVLSIVCGALGLMSLGFCTTAGGQSSFNDTMADKSNSSESEDVYEAFSAGFGFASFFYILAMVFFWTAAIYISPLLCGSANEKMMLKTPKEPEATSAV